jgi:glycosyltransferase involved in cell wall biosynthesis
MSQADFLVLPSECYENFPLVIAEAYAHGLPVLASRLGSLEELVLPGKTGQLFNPRDAEDLSRSARILLDAPERLNSMARDCRKMYEMNYTPTQNLARLREIYDQALGVGK